MRDERGVTIFEVTLALAFLASILLFATVNLQNEAARRGRKASDSIAYERADAVLASICSELEVARGFIRSDGGEITSGDGTSVAYQVPVDPDGDGDYFDEQGSLSWGSVGRNGSALDRVATLYFRPLVLVTETGRRRDLNGDGDLEDSFDLGAIERCTEACDGLHEGHGDPLGPPIVLQERGNHGGDLDTDGHDDPIFFWNTNNGLLRISLHVLTAAKGDERGVSRLEATLFLRPSP